MDRSCKPQPKCAEQKTLSKTTTNCRMQNRRGKDHSQREISSNPHYRNPRLCRERDPLGTGLIALCTACAERELSAEGSRHRWAGRGRSVESQGPNSQHSCAESPLSSRHRPIRSWRRELRAPHLCRESLKKLTAHKGFLSRACGRLSAQVGRQVAPVGYGPHFCAESRWLSSWHRADKRGRGWLLCRELGQHAIGTERI
jgi:hypothetical protein